MKTYAQLHCFQPPEMKAAVMAEAKRLNISFAELFRRMWATWQEVVPRKEEVTTPVKPTQQA